MYFRIIWEAFKSYRSIYQDQMNWEIHNLYLSQVIQVTVNQAVHRIPDDLCLGAVLLGAGPGKRDVKRGGGPDRSLHQSTCKKSLKEGLFGDHGRLRSPVVEGWGHVLVRSRGNNSWGKNQNLREFTDGNLATWAGARTNKQRRVVWLPGAQTYHCSHLHLSGES